MSEPAAASAVAPGVRHFVDAFARERARLPGRDLAWLERLREGAIERFAERGFPTPRDEDWKYTRVDPIGKRAFAPALEPAGAVDAATVAERTADADAVHVLVFVDGRYDPSLSRTGALPAGVRLKSLARALAEDADLLSEHLGRQAGAETNAFTALNAAFVGDGALLHLPRGTSLDEPVHLLFVASGAAEVAASPRVVVVAEAESSAEVVERYAGLGESAYLTNQVTEIAAGANARVRHYKVQEESAAGYHVSWLDARVDAGAHLHSHSVSLGARLARHDIDVALEAEEAGCTLDGLFLGAGRQHVDYHTRVDHLRPHGTSVERYRGLLGGRARGVFNGRVYVHPKAVKTDARQSNDNLLLSRDAEIDTKPQLEIYADDVKCSHGATVGQLDETALFYLRARAIPEETARGLLIYGFAREVLDRIERPGLREAVTAAVLGRLPGAEHVREVVR